jgi:hypothetical protein
MFPQGLASYDDILSWLCVLSDLPMVDLVRHSRRVSASISTLYVSAITLHDGAASDGLTHACTPAEHGALVLLPAGLSYQSPVLAHADGAALQIYNFPSQD